MSGYTSIPLAPSTNFLTSRSSIAPASSSDTDGQSNIFEHDIKSPSYKKRVSLSDWKGRWRIIIPATSILAILSFLFWNRSPINGTILRNKVVMVDKVTLPYRLDHISQKVDQKSTSLGYVPTLNRTLGFEKIYVLNMPYRRDKKAELSILGYQYDLDLEFVDGISGKEIRPDLDSMRDQQGKFGASEAHAGVWRRMLEDGATTALVLEDDVDFSVDIKNQLLRLQEPLAILTSKLDGRPAYKNPMDPYNYAHWDLLWLGEEVEWAWREHEYPPGQSTPYVAYKDPTRSKIVDNDFVKAFEQYKIPRNNGEKEQSERIRLVQAARNAWALSGYAISREGAQKALYMNTHKHWVEHIDFDLMQLCRQGVSRQFSVVPPLFQQRKPLEGEDSERAGIFSSHAVIAGKLGRTAQIQNTARERLFDDLLSINKPILTQ